MTLKLVIDIKVGPLAELNETRKCQKALMITLCWQIYGQFVSILKAHSGPMVCNSYIFINNNLFPYKKWKQNFKISNTAPTLLLVVALLHVKVCLWKKFRTEFSISNFFAYHLLEIYLQHLWMCLLNQNLLWSFRLLLGLVNLLNHLKIFCYWIFMDDHAMCFSSHCQM